MGEPPIVVMGVSGSGKSTVGRDLALALDRDFVGDRIVDIAPPLRRVNSGLYFGEGSLCASENPAGHASVIDAVVGQPLQAHVFPHADMRSS